MSFIRPKVTEALIRDKIADVDRQLAYLKGRRPGHRESANIIQQAIALLERGADLPAEMQAALIAEIGVVGAAALVKRYGLSLAP